MVELGKNKKIILRFLVFVFIIYFAYRLFFNSITMLDRIISVVLAFLIIIFAFFVQYATGDN
ncbi:MAG: hypothetical protein LBD03_07270 [Methanobrevibacter sp.]|jgi:hypothetical protein|nr:hypothetical protein [Candidatus Methanovirga procula]